MNHLIPVAAGLALALGVGFSVASHAAGAANSTVSPEKQSILDEQQALMSSGRGKAKPSIEDGLKETQILASAQPETKLQAGIFEIHAGPFPRATFDVSNAWRGLSPAGDGSWLFVYAGGPLQDPSQDRAVSGGLRVFRAATPDDDFVDLGEFDAADAVGALTLTAGDGKLLTAVDSSGHEFTFDLASDRFV